MIRAGVIADTHGLIRPAALDALRGVDLILHAGDVGRPEVLAALEQIAPVTAVRGNVDRGPWAEALPATAMLQIGRHWFYMLHDLNELDLTPAVAGISAVISGHSHRPSIQTRDGVLLLNPGSAGPRRFQLPISLAVVEVEDDSLRPRLIELPADP